MIRSYFIFPLIYLVGAQWLIASEALVLSLQNVGDRVRAQNLELRAARYIVDEALGLEIQSGRMRNPELEVAVQNNSQSDERGIEVGINQKFPVTGRLRLEKDFSATAVAAARKEIAVVENRLIGEARGLMVELLALRGHQELLRQQAEVVRKLAEFTAEAADKGEASIIDAGQAKLERSRIEAECLRLEAQMKRSQVRLKPLLGMREDEGLVLSGKLPAVETSAVTGASASPAVDLARLEVRKAEQMTEIEQSRRYQDIEAGVFAGIERVIDAPQAPEEEAIIGLRLSMPLPMWNRNEGKIKAARATADRRRAELNEIEQRLGLQAGSLIGEMRQWAGLADEVETKLLPQAVEQTELTERAWRKGQVSLLNVLKSREQRIQLAQTRLDACKNYHLARVRLLTTLGAH